MRELIENNQSKTTSTSTWEENLYWKRFHAMHFYLVLPNDFLHHLALPSKFVEYMANKLPNKVSLRGPGDLTWDVELSKTGTGSVDLVGDGWNDFAKAYSLEQNFLIAFKYKQNSSFEVLIFDQKSLCEKESSYFVKKCLPKPECTTDRKRCVSKAASTEILEDNDDGSDCVLSKKAKKGIAEQDHLSDEVSEDDHNDLEFVVSDKAIDNAIVEVIDCGGRENRSHSTRCVSNDAAAKDGGGLSNTPDKSKAQSVKKPDDGNTTRTVIESDEMEQIPGVIRSRVLKQTIPKHSTKLAFKASIGSRRQSTKDYVSHKRPLSSKENGDALKRANEAFTEGDFIVVLSPSAVYKLFFLSFPSAWIQKNMANEAQEVILRVREKIWETLYRHKVNSIGHVLKSGALVKGWKDFAIQNNLEVSDVCLFKPASKKGDPTLILDVQIFRVVEETTPLICSI